ncbi:hypothetical protein LSG31_22815 [Fodinisporobacter ferrooxydans]|uniref:Uncharacterized protein n=1 Tax=Fodinisporobacter ferrooxydans TaxID=2901836 RepID=A0ABY4CJM5_9BACL|nr:hypothetical protein LSG31_22815 [Alicyclobacillaceae bacterium MYW30-H2]
MNDSMSSYDDPNESWKYQSPPEEDIEEGMSRMEDEGGGVVEQIEPLGAPIHRNALVDVERME